MLEIENNPGAKTRHRVDLSIARSGVQKSGIGRYIRVVKASGTNAKISIALGENRDSNYEELKLNGRIKDAGGFNEIYLKNEAQAGEWVEFIISNGEDDYDVSNPNVGTIDSIGSIDSVVEVQGVGGGAVPISSVHISSMQDLTAWIRDLANENNDSRIQKAPKTSLEGASYAEAVNTTVTVISGAANTNGVYIRLGMVLVEANTQTAEIRVNGNPITPKRYSGNQAQVEIKDIYVPAGASIELYSSHISKYAQLWYKAL